MKYIKLSDVDMIGRPTEGSTIYRKVKSKPYQIAHIALHDLSDGLVIISEEMWKILAKNISLMSRDAILSSPLYTTRDHYFLRTLAAVERRELPATQKEKQEFEEIELFEDQFIEKARALCFDFRLFLEASTHFLSEGLSV